MPEKPRVAQKRLVTARSVSLDFHFTLLLSSFSVLAQRHPATFYALLKTFATSLLLLLPPVLNGLTVGHHCCLEARRIFAMEPAA